MRKVSGKDLLARVKKRQLSEKKINVTYRLREDLVEEFRARCEKEQVSMTSLIEEFMAEFLK